MFVTAMFDKFFRVVFVGEMMMTRTLNSVKEALLLASIVLLGKIRSKFIGSTKEPVVNEVYVCHIEEPETTEMQDLATATYFGMQDVTSNYKRRLAFTDPKTILRDIPFEEVWRVVTKGVDGFSTDNPGRMEVRYTDRFGSDKCVVFRRGRNVTLPLTVTTTSFLSPSLIECRLKVRRKYIDDNGDEVSMCDEEEDADDLGSVVGLVGKWIPNSKSFDDDLVGVLAMRDILIEHSHFIRFMMKDSAYAVSRYEVELEMTFSNLECRGKAFLFTWDNNAWLRAL